MGSEGFHAAVQTWLTGSKPAAGLAMGLAVALGVAAREDRVRRFRVK
ncbi:MAG TPA: hypothetical protein VLC73_08420 [Burkholderiales bacterium]|nr:hypothetical protein [Burkholderiales bacterium]